MPREFEEVTLPNLKVYRAAWIVTLIVIVIALFTLGSPDTPKLSPEPVSFDGERAAEDLRTLAREYPQRVAGSDPDNRAAVWVQQEMKRIGLETHIESFTATVNGKTAALQNVYGISKGTTAGTIVLVANRDVVPLATQGANDNASGVAALLELARTFNVTAHGRSIIFLCTSGDAYGALGARNFVENHQSDNVLGVIALSRVAGRDANGVSLDGWSSTSKVAPPWLWLVSAPAARVAGNLEVELPTFAAQILRLAVPTSAGSQGPFVGVGAPAITVSADTASVPAAADTLNTVSSETLTRMGDTVQAMVMAIDDSAGPGERSGGTIFLTRKRTLSGGALAVILAMLLLPLTAVTVDLYAHCRRARITLRTAFLRAALHLAPWLVLIAIVYFANFIGQLPKSPDAVIPPGSRLALNPRYLRVAVLAVLMVAAYAYAVAVEHRLERRVWTDPRATIFVAHLVLTVIALLTILIDPYAALLVVPAAVLWPLARAGGWVRSALPVYLGLIMIPVVLVYYGLRFGIGWKVWWYLFLLFENRTVPPWVVLLAALFLSTAGILAHTLHERGLAPAALTWPSVERRAPDRPSDGEWAISREAQDATRPATRQRPRTLRGRRRPKKGDGGRGVSQ